MGENVWKWHIWSLETRISQNGTEVLKFRVLWYSIWWVRAYHYDAFYEALICSMIYVKTVRILLFSFAWQPLMYFFQEWQPGPETASSPTKGGIWKEQTMKDPFPRTEYCILCTVWHIKTKLRNYSFYLIYKNSTQLTQ